MNKWLCMLLMACFSVAMLSTGACYSSERVMRLSDGKIISFDQMMDEIADKSVIIVGENHDDATHHEAQLAVINAMAARKKPVAVGMEMFPAESQPHLDRWVAGRTEQREFIRLYSRSWKMPWPLYRDIFLYVRDKRIPLLGLNVPQQVTKRVATRGFAALSEEEKRRLPPDITCDVDPTYMTFIRNAYRAHGNSASNFIHFCEAQKLWNRSMAWYLVRYLGKNPHHSVVVVTGAGHALKRAVPAELADLSTFSTAVIMPQMEDLPLDFIKKTDADYLMLRR